MQKVDFGIPKKGNIYTLAQSGTGIKLVKGEGTDAKALKPLQNRAKKKTISNTVILKLIEISKENGEHYKEKAYRNSFYCQSKVIKANGRLFGDYCKNRFCTICAGIRKADIINRYLPIIGNWEQPYFVTLTAKAVPKLKLKDRYDRMYKGIIRLLERNKKRAQRGKAIRFMGIRTIECNFNPQRRTYNPHLHLLVANKQMAEQLINEWLIQCTPTHAKRAAQHMRAVNDTEKDLIEIIKYGSKIFTDPTMQSKTKRKYNPIIYAKAYHNIIWAMQGHRVFERFGFNLPQKARNRKVEVVTDYEELMYSAKDNDWICIDTDESLTNYQPSNELMAILADNIDLDAE